MDHQAIVFVDVNKGDILFFSPVIKAFTIIKIQTTLSLSLTIKVNLQTNIISNCFQQRQFILMHQNRDNFATTDINTLFQVRQVPSKGFLAFVDLTIVPVIPELTLGQICINSLLCFLFVIKADLRFVELRSNKQRISKHELSLHVHRFLITWEFVPHGPHQWCA